MIKKYKRYILLLVFLIISFNLVGCSSIKNLEIKLGMRNEDFEYLNSESVEEVSIQNIRDSGFRFIVTEPSAIRDMYLLLAKAKKTDKKSTLEPDYVFQFNLGDEVKKFYYVVGSDEGNFYNEDSVYTVSKRLDEGIMTNLSFIRKPRQFEYIYYQSILDVLNKYKTVNDMNSQSVGLNIEGDVDCLKYIFSNDLKEFTEDVKEISSNIEMTNNNIVDFDTVITVKNRGFDSVNFKTLVTINDKIENIEYKYYVIANNTFNEWNIEVIGPNPDKLPAEW